MSRSITAEVTVNVKQQLKDAVAASPRSKLISELTHPLLRTRNANTLQHDGSVVGLLAARAGTLATQPGWLAAVEREEPQLLTDAQRLLAESRQKLATGNTNGATLLAQEGDRRLREALGKTANALAGGERKQAATLVERALTSIGCRTTLREGSDLSGLCAERGHQRLVGLVENRGLVRLDIAGCEGDACEPLQRDFERAVREHGGILEQVESRAHGDDRGGVFMQQAALAAGQDTLADGVIRQEVARRRAGIGAGAGVALDPLAQRS
jgi:hypothetical protein